MRRVSYSSSTDGMRCITDHPDGYVPVSYMDAGQIMREMNQLRVLALRQSLSDSELRRQTELTAEYNKRQRNKTWDLKAKE